MVNYLHRCARTLQYDPEIANPGSVANRSAVPFWEANRRNRNVIPSDKQVLPTLSAPETITIKRSEKPKIVIKAQTEKPKITIVRKT